MIENLNFILKVIESDIFLSYFYYTLIFLIISLFIRDKRKYKLDDIFTLFLIHSGIFFIGIIIIKSVLLFIIPDLPNRTKEINKRRKKETKKERKKERNERKTERKKETKKDRSEERKKEIMKRNK